MIYIFKIPKQRLLYVVIIALSFNIDHQHQVNKSYRLLHQHQCHAAHPFPFRLLDPREWHLTGAVAFLVPQQQG